MSAPENGRETSGETSGHIPVQLVDMLDALQPASSEIYVDGTFGGGGYTGAILEQVNCKVIAIDRDPDAAERAQDFKKLYGDRFVFIAGEFGRMDTLLVTHGLEKVDGVVLDIGVSSFQLDEAERGFSFRSDGPLDMRMAKSGDSAADVVNTFQEGEIADILYKYGEEKKSRRIASAIIKARENEPFTRTKQLADLVEKVLGRPPKPKGKAAVHPATRTFQALRIYVNDELGELERGLKAAEKILAPNGRLVVVTFHSLEDRIVKNFLAVRAGRAPAGSRHMPQKAQPDPSFYLGKNKVIKPSEAECAENPRARSAKLRWAIRTEAPPYKMEAA